MSDPIVVPPLSALRSQAEFETALRWSVGHALAVRSRVLTWTDPDFAQWPLDEAWLLDGLTAWLRLPQRRLVLLARHYAVFEREHARFVAWRRTWSHLVDAWSPCEGTEARLPMLVIDDRNLCLQVFDTVSWRGRLSLDERSAREWHDEIDALLQRCEAAFPAYRLGL